MAVVVLVELEKLKVADNSLYKLRILSNLCSLTSSTVSSELSSGNDPISNKVLSAFLA